ncbi:MAG: transcription termination/antitermination protein NusA, partial [Ilumatobacteraceae bacterium]|nr:transcription termination/antitermination protein NusA [Ilumatobacteraceae bacterium]
IKGCAREPGHRTKIAVWSNDHNVDPVGACVGARGGRVRMVVNELRGEKIDIVPFSEDLADFVAKALSPAKVVAVIISDDGTQADVIVPDNQLSLAIGKEGQNARLAARLTGVRIDIRGETEPLEGLDDDADYEEGEWVANAETGAMEWHAADGSILTQEQWSEQAAAAPAEEDVATDESAASVDETDSNDTDSNDTDSNEPAVAADAAGETQEIGGEHV